MKKKNSFIDNADYTGKPMCLTNNKCMSKRRGLCIRVRHCVHKAEGTTMEPENLENRSAVVISPKAPDHLAQLIQRSIDAVSRQIDAEIKAILVDIYPELSDPFKFAKFARTRCHILEEKYANITVKTMHVDGEPLIRWDDDIDIDFIGSKVKINAKKPYKL